jgi:GT2 family glycosyltransferase
MPIIRLPRSVRPRASIIVIARRNVHLLARCLTALSEKGVGSADVEVILAVNNPDPDVAAFVERGVQGAIVVRSDVNMGFAGANNLASREADGEYIVLLNDDTETEPGWLHALIDVADAHPEAGAVGSRILFPDGTLQEAGSVVWQDGTTAAVGRGLPADTPQFRYLRKVDYCSGCSLLVRRSSWIRVGGLSDDFFPLYYEDTDLCLAIARGGESVLYCPTCGGRRRRCRQWASTCWGARCSRNSELPTCCSMP